MNEFQTLLIGKKGIERLTTLNIILEDVTSQFLLPERGTYLIKHLQETHNTITDTTRTQISL